MATKTKQSSWTDWLGATVVDSSGDKIGTLENVYMDRGSGQPEWFAIRTGLFGMSESFAPMEGFRAEGDTLVLPCAKDLVKDAPSVGEHDGYLDPSEEERLYRHYGRKNYQPWNDDDIDITDRAVAEGRSTADQRRRDEAMTRSEEELVVGKREHEAGRVRLRKWVETENVSMTVPVRKQKARLVSEPITDENVDEAMSGPEITESDHEVVLTEEEPVVATRAVPKERVRVETDEYEQEETVSGDVRKEHIEVDDDTGNDLDR